MRFLLIIVLNLLLCLEGYAQQWDWAKGLSSNFYSHAKNLEVSSCQDGSVVTLGSFNANIHFRTTNGLEALEARKNRLNYLVKTDSTGEVLWNLSLGNIYQGYISQHDKLNCNFLAVDDSSNNYILGIYSDSIDFDPGLNKVMGYTYNTTSSFSSAADIYLLKIDKNGEFQWVKEIKIPDFSVQRNIIPRAVRIDSKGNPIISGNFYGDFDFDPGPSAHVLTSSEVNSTNITVNSFLLKLNSNGDFVWVKNFTGFNQTYLNQITPNDEIVVVGKILGDSIDCNPSSSVDFILTNVWTKDYFINKLDSMGNFIAAGTMPTNGNQNAVGDIKVDSFGAIYMALNFQQGDSIDIDMDTISSNIVTHPNPFSIALKLNSNLTSSWFQLISSTGFSHSNTLGLSNEGAIIAGRFSGVISYTNSIHDTSVTNIYADMFLLELGTTGSFKKSRKISDSTSSSIWAAGQSINDLSINDRGNIYLACDISGIPQFGTNSNPWIVENAQRASYFVELDSNLITSNADWLVKPNFINSYKVDNDSLGNAFHLVGFSGAYGYDSVTSVIDSVYCFVLNKLDSSGVVIWEKKFIDQREVNANYYDYASHRLAVSNNGDTYLTGIFGGVMDADPGPAIYPIGQANSQSVYFIKLAADGSLLWAKSLPNNQSAIPAKIQLDDNSNAYILFSRISDLGVPSNTLTVQISSSFHSDGLLKIDSSGNYIKAYLVDNNMSLFDFTLANDNLVILCEAISNINLGVYGAYTFLNTNRLLLSLNSQDSLNWGKTSGLYQARMIESDKLGNILVHIRHLGNYLYKLDSNGIGIWSLNLDGNLSNHTDFHYYCMETDSLNNVILGGRGPYDGSLTKVDPVGNEFSYSSFGREIRDIKMSPIGMLTIGGTYVDPIYINSSNSTSLESYGEQNIFISSGRYCQQITDVNITECDDMLDYYGDLYDTSGLFVYGYLDQSGCDSIIKVKLTTPNFDSTKVYQLNDTLICRDTIGNFQWFNCDSNKIIQGATNAYFVPAKSGNYAIIINRLGCSDTSTCLFSNVVNTYSLSLIKSSKDIIYPNPSQGVFNISLDKEYTNVRMKIMDASGRIVVSNQLDDIFVKRFEINCPPGIYFLQLVLDGHRRIYKLVIEKW